MENKILGGVYTWKEAIDSQGDGWRLPDVFELMDIRATDTEDKIKTGYWSASPHVSNAANAWSVLFNSDFVDACNKSVNNYIRLVRGESVVQESVAREAVTAYRVKQQKPTQESSNGICQMPAL